MKKRNFVLIALSLVLLVCMLASCDNTGKGDTTADESETETPVETILLEDLKKYILIRPEEIGNDFSVAISRFKSQFEKKTGLDSIKYKDDFYKEGSETLKINEFEILVGRTNRPESKQFLSSLRYKDYGYTVINKKIVIAGHTEETTESAIDLFISNVLDAEKTDGVFMESTAVVNKSEYKTENMTLGELPVNGLMVVYTGSNKLSEKDFAEDIASALSEISGYYVPATTDKNLELAESDNIILVGDSERIDRLTKPDGLEVSESYIAYSDHTILITGGGTLGLYNAAHEFISRIEESDGKLLELKAEETFTLTSNSTRVMSFNLWVSNRTVERTFRVLKMITNYMPDSIGVQEANPLWMASLIPGLPAYDYVGEGRDGGNSGEYSAIFYLKDKYTVVESGTKWLSATPDSVSKFEESSLNRICTYAVLKNKMTGEIYVHINTHFDHKSATAREKQVEVLLDVAEQFTNYPIVITGDFNCTPDSAPYNRIVSEGFFNSSDMAPEKHGTYTFHNYGSSASIIDFCFLTRGKMSAISYRVCDEKIDGDYPSDHYPVLVDFIF